MSFSSGVKEELSRRFSSERHCNIAEIAAIIGICGRIFISEEDTFQLLVQTENVTVARKYFTLLKKTFNIEAEIRIRKNTYLKKTSVYCIVVASDEDTVRILRETLYMNEDMEIAEDICVSNQMLLREVCCRQAFVRGVFLASGSVSDPEKSYHLEMVFSSEDSADQIKKLLCGFGLEARVVTRKNHKVVYLKEGLQIMEFLDLMGAGVSLMNLESVRARKEISNNVNRKVNCEAANITKTVQAAMKQIEDIRYIEKQKEFSQLSKGLKEIAGLRLQYPDASLKELGEMLDPPVGKSGVNHRLRKLSEMADELRWKKEESYD